MSRATRSHPESNPILIEIQFFGARIGIVPRFHSRIPITSAIPYLFLIVFPPLFLLFDTTVHLRWFYYGRLVGLRYKKQQQQNTPIAIRPVQTSSC